MLVRIQNLNLGYGTAIFAVVVLCVSACSNSARAQTTREATIQLEQKPVVQKQLTESPRGPVTIIVQGNQLTLTGAKRDVAIVKQAIKLIQQKMKAVSDPVVSERIALKFQMADVVVTLMNNMMESSISGPPVKIESLHFPESVLLVGPRSSIKQAKELLATIDSYEFLKGKTQTKKSPANRKQSKPIF